MVNLMARLEGMLPDNPKVMIVSVGLSPSFPLVINDFGDTNFDYLSVLTPVCGQLALLRGRQAHPTAKPRHW